LGFDLVGACPAVAPPHLAAFQQWLAAGYAGEMAYLGARADAYAHPRAVLDGARSLLVLAMNYRSVEPAEPAPGQGRVSRYAWGQDYHELVRQRLRQLGDFHRRLLPEALVRGVVDTAPLLERDFAQLAGLGWIGKNTLLISRGHGSWIFLAVLLSAAELEYDAPFAADHCGVCRACLDACPTGALVAPYQLDARRCLSYTTIELRGPIAPELRRPHQSWVFGCDVCQDVCPWNRKPPATAEPAFVPAEQSNPLPLAELFDLDEDQFAARFGPTPLARARRRGLLRNAALALGNQPHPAALPALIRGLNDADPLVRGVCAWAIAHYDSPAAQEALTARLAVETDAAVRGEIGESMK